MDKKNFTSISLQEEMQRSYLEYAMSVIVGRALPDARDGLKPVQRRIIFAMYELGLTPDKPFRKCARVVGDVLGKYHPHGDQAVYDALVRLVQNFSTKYPTLDGHGNFGSVDNDPPAAMRYTETRLAPIAHKALYAGLSKIKAGNTLLDVAGEIEDIVVKNGFSVVEDYTGHGVGRNLHEEPSVFNFRTKELPNVVLREGMTLAVEPIVNEGTKFCKTLNDRWTVITKDGKLSAQWEHTIVVLKDGIEILTDRDF